ncbi:MAG: hypothetical protein JO235_14500 [Chroococcidiopsidaceae cyanobacterium CP_BM_RX_35]|nr:hypothetical protein [Chroococcidiopsidaceae cyanobacterium CP_BM_RX_35]
MLIAFAKSAELHPTLIQNLMFLEDYFGSTAAVPTPLQARVLDRVHLERQTYLDMQSTCFRARFCIERGRVLQADY